jgi:hypothetical protein
MPGSTSSVPILTTRFAVLSTPVSRPVNVVAAQRHRNYTSRPVSLRAMAWDRTGTSGVVNAMQTGKEKDD